MIKNHKSQQLYDNNNKTGKPSVVIIWN